LSVEPDGWLRRALLSNHGEAYHHATSEE
jgi:hypothetical protein